MKIIFFFIIWKQASCRELSSHPSYFSGSILISESCFLLQRTKKRKRRRTSHLLSFFLEDFLVLHNNIFPFETKTFDTILAETCHSRLNVYLKMDSSIKRQAFLFFRLEFRLVHNSQWNKGGTFGYAGWWHHTEITRGKVEDFRSGKHLLSWHFVHLITIYNIMQTCEHKLF